MAGTTKKDLATVLDQLRKWSDNVRKQINDDPEFKRLSDNQELPGDSRLWGVLRNAAEDQVFRKYLDMAGAGQQFALREAVEGNSIQLERFLERMSQSMVRAQHLLDAESGRYLAATADKRHILPSIFRMPKLSAQMRFALDVQNEESLNLVFYQRDEKTTSRNEQAIDFDIVTVPAPPDAREAVQRLAPRLELLLDPFERGRVMEAIRSTQPKESLKPLIGAASEDARIVILSGNAAGDVQRYLLLLAGDGGEHDVGVWILVLTSGAVTQFDPILRYKRDNGEAEIPLRDLVLELSRKQQSFFAD